MKSTYTAIVSLLVTTALCNDGIPQLRRQPTTLVKAVSGIRIRNDELGPLASAIIEGVSSEQVEQTTTTVVESTTATVTTTTVTPSSDNPTTATPSTTPTTSTTTDITVVAPTMSVPTIVVDPPLGDELERLQAKVDTRGRAVTDAEVKKTDAIKWEKKVQDYCNNPHKEVEKAEVALGGAEQKLWRAQKELADLKNLIGRMRPE